MLQRDQETRAALNEIEMQALEIETQKAALEQVGGGQPTFMHLRYHHSRYTSMYMDPVLDLYSL